MDLVSFRNLAQPVGQKSLLIRWKPLRPSYKIKDLNDAGEPTERPGELKDRFVNPSRISLLLPLPIMKGAAWSIVIAKARTYYRGFSIVVFDAITGANITTGAKLYLWCSDRLWRCPRRCRSSSWRHYNKYFPGNFIAMPNMLSDGLVTYQWWFATNRLSICTGCDSLFDVDSRTKIRRTQTHWFSSDGVYAAFHRPRLFHQKENLVERFALTCKQNRHYWGSGLLWTGVS